MPNMTKAKIDITVPQKQSAVALILSILKVLREMWALFLVIGINLVTKKDATTKASFYILLGLITIFVLKINTILSYFTTKFYVNQLNELVYTSGLFVRKKTVISINNIQTIQANQNVVNRISNTYKVAIQTAGTSKAEIELFAISARQLQALQNILSAESLNFKKEENLTAHNSFTFKLNIKGLLKLCISENHLQSFLIIAAFLFGKLQELKDLVKFDATTWIEEKVDNTTLDITHFIMFFTFCMLIAIVYSCIRIILKYFDFGMHLNEDNLQLNWGLINTQHKIIGYKKIQTIDWKSNAIRRILNLSICNIVALGDDITKKDSTISLPITHQYHLHQLLQKISASWVFDKNDFLPIHPSFVLRYTLLIGLPVSCIASCIALILNKYYLLLFIFIWLMYFILSKWIFRKRFKLFVNEHGLKIYTGVWGTAEQIIAWENIQKISLKTSPYQRKHELASLQLLNAGKQINIPYISIQQAQFITNYSLYKTETMV